MIKRMHEHALDLINSNIDHIQMGKKSFANYVSLTGKPIYCGLGKEVPIEEDIHAHENEVIFKAPTEFFAIIIND